MHALLSAIPLVLEPACACHEEAISIVLLQMGVCKSQVHSVGVPYWFLPDEGGAMTPATYEEMADTHDVYLKVTGYLCGFVMKRCMHYLSQFSCLLHTLSWQRNEVELESGSLNSDDVQIVHSRSAAHSIAGCMMAVLPRCDWHWFRECCDVTKCHAYRTPCHGHFPATSGRHRCRARAGSGCCPSCGAPRHSAAARQWQLEAVLMLVQVGPGSSVSHPRPR
jgi:hypothetical protein